MALPTFGKMRLTALVAVLSFGLTALLAIIVPGPLEALVPAVFVTGYFILIPLIWILGDQFPLVAPSDESTATTERPIAELRDRYAAGEIDEAEFERKLDQLLATEDIDERFDEVGSDGSRVAESTAKREREFDLE